jgi:hypothetical protein
MAQKKPTPEQRTAPVIYQPAQPGDLGSLADLANHSSRKAEAIRLLRDHLFSQGREPDLSVIAAIYARTKWSSGNQHKDKNYISSLLSTDRRRMGQPAAKPGRRPMGFPPEPAASELIGLKQLGIEAMARILAEKVDSFESFVRVVGAVDEIANQFGGFERLKKCILCWKQLVGTIGSSDH